MTHLGVSIGWEGERKPGRGEHLGEQKAVRGRSEGMVGGGEEAVLRWGPAQVTIWEGRAVSRNDQSRLCPLANQELRSRHWGTRDGGGPPSRMQRPPSTTREGGAEAPCIQAGEEASGGRPATAKGPKVGCAGGKWELLKRSS